MKNIFMHEKPIRKGAAGNRPDRGVRPERPAYAAAVRVWRRTVLEELEETLRCDPLHRWIRLKVFPGHNLAIGWFRLRGGRAPLSTVCAFVASRESFMDHEMLSIDRIAPTMRRFRKGQKKIAKWYFRKLCRTFRNGIIVPANAKRPVRGRRDE